MLSETRALELKSGLWVIFEDELLRIGATQSKNGKAQERPNIDQH